MGTLSKEYLSGSSNGKQIVVTGTNSGGAVIVHTPHNTAKDEIWLFADNDDTSDVVLTIEWGGTTDVTNTIKKRIPGRNQTTEPDGLINVICGIPITGNSNVVKAFAGSASKIKLTGYVIRDA